MAENFRDKTIFITGASSGIGKATALAFAGAGAKVAVADLMTRQGEETVEAIRNTEGSAFFVKCDVSREEDVKNAVAQTLENYGRLDFAFNNAGIEGEQSLTSECTTENWDRVIGINLKGVWLCMKYQIRQMLEQGHGVIVNCSSIAGLVGFPELPAYVTSKHGILGLTKTAALEYAKSGIRINAVCPGVIHTPMIDRLTRHRGHASEDLVRGEPMGRMGKPEEIARAVLWLCSEGASFVTGHPLVVDGGWVSQ